ncbi:MAG: AmmeMemoRadiSam system protein B [Acidobacteriota bacterium]
MERPKLRPVEVFPLEVSGKRLLCLRDPLRYGQDVVISPVLAEIIRYFDGTRTVREIQYQLMSATGELIYGEVIEKIVQELDLHLLLDSEHFGKVRNSIEAEFVATSIRRAAHAGLSYPADATQLETQLQSFFLAAEGAGLPTNNGHKPRVRGIIAPHIDLRCAGPCYTWAYRELVEGAADCETIVILGTSHYGFGKLFIVTEKDFETPLGRLQCDREFIATLQTQLNGSLKNEEGAHRLEHSIEFQVIFLQTLFKNRKLPKIVPILVTSFQPLIETVERPHEYQEFTDFVTALRRTIAQWPYPVSFVVGADLAHVGRKFGDRFAAQPQLARIEEADREMLNYVEAHDVDGFFQSIKAVNDNRRICGFPPILTFLATIDGLQGRLLKYEQWSETATESAVTYASMAFYE